MKKLLVSAAVCGLALSAVPAHAELKLDVGGWFKGYGVYIDQDDNSTTSDDRSLDFVRHTEVHFGGETTLDNGLTVGMHFETEADGGDSFDVEESYAYFAGGWGRVNFGAEDGAAYLLQVAAPSADDNVDGLRSFVQPVNYTVTGGTGLTGVTAGLDYDQDPTGTADKLTYLSPIMSGFQVGLTYAPEITDNSGIANDFEGVRTDDEDNEFGAAYEAALRYEGQFNNVGVIAGVGYSHVDLEANTFVAGTASDDRSVWNAGLDLDIGAFGVGVAYLNDDFGDTEITTTTNRDEEETWVVGADYTTGPFKLGASYMNKDATQNIAGTSSQEGVETDRYSGGVVYTYGPGMTFRGSLNYVEHDDVAGLTGTTEVDATSLLLGTQINF